MTPLSTEIARLRALCDKATPAPWSYWDKPSNDLIAGNVKKTRDGDEKGKLICALAGVTSRPHDFRFIAEARTALPMLLDKLEIAVAALELIAPKDGPTTDESDELKLAIARKIATDALGRIAE